MAEILTIDGPGASGKGTVAIRIARQLGWHLLPSGSIYRAMALKAARQSVAPAAEAELVKLIPRTNLSFSLQQDALQVYLGDEDVSEILAADSIAEFASQIAQHRKLRQELLAFQRSFARPPGLVAEGRDMGSVVFPDAKHKIFITATVEERARRRYQQLQSRNSPLDDERQILRALQQRDKQDRERQAAPLLQPAGATIIDTTDLSIDQTVRQILARVQA